MVQVHVKAISWGFKSLHPHQKLVERRAFFFSKSKAPADAGAFLLFFRQNNFEIEFHLIHCFPVTTEQTVNSVICRIGRQFQNAVFDIRTFDHIGLFPVPAFPVRYTDFPVYLIYFSAVSKIVSFSMVWSMLWGEQRVTFYLHSVYIFASIRIFVEYEYTLFFMLCQILKKE